MVGLLKSGPDVSGRFLRSEAPPAVHFSGDSSRCGPFRWGPVYRLTGQLSGRTQNFLPGSWLKILWPVHLTLDRWNGRGLRLPPGKSTAGNRPQGWRRKGRQLRIRRSFLTHRQVCRERRSRRDRGGATGTVAASLVFQTSDRSGSPKPRQRVRRRLAGAPAAACRSRA